MKIMQIGLAAFLLSCSSVSMALAGDSVFLEKAPGLITEEGNRLPLPALMPQMVSKTISHDEASPDCANNILKISIYYPKGTGNAAIDQEIEKAVTDAFNSQINEIKTDGFCDKEFCGTVSCEEWPVNRSFAVYAPSTGYISVLFNEVSFTGGAHGNSVFEVMNFDLKTGKRVTLADLFPDAEKSVPLYWDYVYGAWCSENGYKFPLHYQPAEGDCMAEDPDNPRNYEGVKTIDDLGRLVFTNKGATIVLGPYESGSYATGERYLDIPKDELLKMGASAKIWEQVQSN